MTTQAQYDAATSAVRAMIEPEIPAMIKMHIPKAKLDQFYVTLAQAAVNAAYPPKF